jgi:hypothetical protein
VSRELAAALALIAAVALLLASMLWSTTARGQAPDTPGDVVRVERAVGELQAARARLVALGGNDGYAPFVSFGTRCAASQVSGPVSRVPRLHKRTKRRRHG